MSTVYLSGAEAILVIHQTIPRGTDHESGEANASICLTSWASCLDKNRSNFVSSLVSSPEISDLNGVMNVILIDW